MAVINAYTNPLISGNIITKSLRAFNSTGADGGQAYAVAQIAASDNNGSVYRLFKNLSQNMVITGIVLANTSLTSGVSYGLGLYATNLSLTTATTIGYFSGVMNLVTAHASITAGTALDALAGISISTVGAQGTAGTAYSNRLFEHAGLTINTNNRPDAYDLCLTATTASTVAGTVGVLITYVMD